MSIESSLTFFLTILIFGIIPGPTFFAITARATTLGAKQCISFSLGDAIGDVIYLIFACLGLATIANNYAFLFEIIRIIGGLYLLYLAYKIFITPIEINNEEVNKKQLKKDFIYGFIQGFLISASNPKVILFYIVFIPTFLDIKSLSSNDIIWVSFLTIIALMISLMSIAILANRAKKLLKLKSSAKRINYISGFIMSLVGLFLLFKKQS